VSAALPTTPKASSGVPAEQEFAVIYAQHFGFVWRCLRALGVIESALDDAAQEVFLVVHRRLGDFRGDSSLRTWLYGVVRNVAGNQRRSVRRRPRPAPLEFEPESTDADPHEHAQEREAAEFVRRFADGLDDKKRDVFVLALVEQLSIPEVAETLRSRV
jgi:RNA polymerase sigma-70 factor (ECF subfamily)